MPRLTRDEIEVEIEEIGRDAVQTDIGRNSVEVTHGLAFNDFRYVTGAPGVGCGEVRQIHEPPAPHEVKFGFMGGSDED
jgi:hypothetical protein